MSASGPPSRDRALALWLAACTFLVATMIVVGGLTRLTRSGLSITTWEPIVGVIPPLGDAAWERAYASWADSPEGHVRAAEMDLASFRAIYLVEWGHRLLGRLLAVVALVPMSIFAIRRRLPRVVALRVGVVVAGGALQGLLGWLMVASGLVDVPHVSPYRLAAHFVVGVALFVALLWSTLDLVSAPQSAPTTRSIRVLGGAVFVLVFALLVWGALMAGHHAGLLFPDFPTMAGQWIPDGTLGDPPHFGSVFGDAITVHFVHRVLALSLLFTSVVLLASLAPSGFRRARLLAATLVAVVVVQIGLGAATVIGHVPIALASTHQLGAIVVVAFATTLLRELRSATRYAAIKS